MNTFIKIIIGATVIGTIVISPIIAYGTKSTVQFVVSDKERVMTSESSKYLVFTDGEVYENTDSLWYFKFNSSDVYGSLHEGQKYEAVVYGFRVPFLSWYKNIVSVKHI